MNSQFEIKTGALVVYKEPRRFFAIDKGRDFIGVVTQADLIHAKVFWQDGLWCLESLEDLSSFEWTIYCHKMTK
jgi:hypothetical protein